jgi:hypothetical protein
VSGAVRGLGFSSFGHVMQLEIAAGNFLVAVILLGFAIHGWTIRTRLRRIGALVLFAANLAAGVYGLYGHNAAVILPIFALTLGIWIAFLRPAELPPQLEDPRRQRNPTPIEMWLGTFFGRIEEDLLGSGIQVQRVSGALASGRAPAIIVRFVTVLLLSLIVAGSCLALERRAKTHHGSATKPPPEIAANGNHKTKRKPQVKAPVVDSPNRKHAFPNLSVIPHLTSEQRKKFEEACPQWHLPGYDAGATWKRAALIYAWIGLGAPGAIAAGCPGATQTLEKYIDEFVYAIGVDPNDTDILMSVAVYWRARDLLPVSILEPRATIALRLIAWLGPLAASARAEVGRGDIQLFYNEKGSYITYRSNRASLSVVVLPPGASDFFYSIVIANGWQEPSFDGVDPATGRRIYTFWQQDRHDVPTATIEYDPMTGDIYKKINGRWLFVWYPHTEVIPVGAILRRAPDPVGLAKGAS